MAGREKIGDESCSKARRIFGTAEEYMEWQVQEKPHVINNKMCSRSSCTRTRSSLAFVVGSYFL